MSSSSLLDLRRADTLHWWAGDTDASTQLHQRGSGFAAAESAECACVLAAAAAARLRAPAVIHLDVLFTTTHQLSYQLSCCQPARPTTLQSYYEIIGEHIYYYLRLSIAIN